MAEGTPPSLFLVLLSCRNLTCAARTQQEAKWDSGTLRPSRADATDTCLMIDHGIFGLTTA